MAEEGGGKVQRENCLTQAEMEEIRVMYRDAKYKRQQIGILSEMYLVSKDTIAQVLGLEALPGGRGYKTRPAVRRQWLG